MKLSIMKLSIMRLLFCDCTEELNSSLLFPSPFLFPSALLVRLFDDGG